MYFLVPIFFLLARSPASSVVHGREKESLFGTFGRCRLPALPILQILDERTLLSTWAFCETVPVDEVQ